MNIWLVTTGEPLPFDGKNERLHRIGILSELLSLQNHRVTWWASTFDHLNKDFRYNSDTTYKINENHKIKLLHSIPYYKNISFRRIINHYGVAKKFKSLAYKELQPDIVLCSFPTIDLSFEAVKYGKTMKVPVILDVRDLWPDIFLDLFPKWSYTAARIALLPLFKRTRAAFNSAYAVTGITPNFVRWGVKQAGRAISEMDRSFPFGYPAKSPSSESIEDARIFWSQLGIRPDDGYYNVCFFGTIGHQFDLETVIEASRIMQGLNKPVRFILCGAGDRLLEYKSLAANLTNVIFPGWVNFPEIWLLMKYSSVGLAPYNGSSTFQENIPNKIIEYFAGGLPILSCINGIVDQIISVHKCGFTYERGNTDSLIMELMKLLNNPGLLEKMAKNAFSIYLEKYNAEAVYGEMIEYLEDVVQTFKRRAA